jgi:hypothetical protein
MSALNFLVHASSGATAVPMSRAVERKSTPAAGVRANGEIQVRASTTPGKPPERD